MKRLLTMLLAFLLLLTSCAPQPPLTEQNSADDLAPVEESALPKGYYTSGYSLSKAFYFKSDVFGRIRYQVINIEYPQTLPDVFDLTHEAIDPVTGKVDSDYALVHVEMEITQTDRGALPDLTAGNSVSVDCLRLYMDLDYEGQSFEASAVPVAYSSNVKESKTVELVEDEPETVHLLYIVEDRVFHFDEVALSVQPTAINDLHHKDIRYILLERDELTKPTDRTSDRDPWHITEMWEYGYYDIFYGKSNYYIANDEITNYGNRLDESNFGVGIFKRSFDGGRDELIATIPYAKICSGTALIHNGVIYFPLYKTGTGYGSKYSSSSHYSTVYAYDLETNKLTELCRFTRGYNTTTYIQGVENGMLILDNSYIVNYVSHLMLEGITDEEYLEYSRRNYVYVKMAYDLDTRELYRVESDGVTLTPLFSPKNIVYSDQDEGIVSPDYPKNEYYINDIEIYSTLAETGFAIAGDYSDSTRFIVCDMSVTVNSNQTPQLEIIASTQPDTPYYHINIYDSLYGEDLKKPEIIYCDGFPTDTQWGGKYDFKIVIAADEVYINEADVYLTFPFEGPVTDYTRISYMPVTDSILIPRKQYTNYWTKEIVDGYYPITYNGNSIVIYSGMSRDVTFDDGLKYTSDYYPVITFERLMHDLSGLASVNSGRLTNRSIFGSNVLLDAGVIYFATASEVDGRNVVSIGSCSSIGIDDRNWKPIIDLVDYDITDLSFIRFEDDRLYMSITHNVDGISVTQQAYLLTRKDIPIGKPFVLVEE